MTVIRERMRILEENARREEDAVRTQARIALGKEALRMQYRRRPGVDRERVAAAERAHRSHRPSLETAVWRLAGKNDRLASDRAVGRKTADAISSRLAEEIVDNERAVDENIRAQKQIRDQLADNRTLVADTRVELLRYIRAEHADPSARLDAALCADRIQVLLERVSATGGALYRTLSRLAEESRGSGRYALSREEKPVLDIPLREAYAAQGERKAAEILEARMAFLAEWHTWLHWNPDWEVPPAPALFSEALWDTAPVLLQGQRRGDEWIDLLRIAQKELAALLVPVEGRRETAGEEKRRAYEDAGITMAE